METKDISRINELIHKVNKVQGNNLEVKNFKNEILIRPTKGVTLYSTDIENIIKYVEATSNNWYISVDERSLFLYCF